MKILHLTLNKKWFDMILSGEKKAEYREIKDYWTVRLKEGGTITGDFKKFDAIIFKNGHSKGVREMKVRIDYITFGTGLTAWGAEEFEVYYIIHLLDIIETKNIK